MFELLDTGAASGAGGTGAGGGQGTPRRPAAASNAAAERIVPAAQIRAVATMRAAAAEATDAKRTLADGTTPTTGTAPHGRKPPPVTAGVEGGRLCLTLSTVATAAVVFIAGSLLATAYLVGLRIGASRGEADGFERGRNWYQAEVAGEIEQARTRPPVAELIAGLEARPGSIPLPAPQSRPAPGLGDASGPPAASPLPDAAAATWVTGNNYVVVQGFAPGAERAAESAREFLRREGIQTAVVPMANGWHRLITVQGFNLAEAAQKGVAERLMEQIRQAGQRFRAAGGQYDFHDCYLVKLEKDSW